MLIHAIRHAVADAGARSFRVTGDDLVSLTFADMRAACDAYDEAFRAVPEALRRAVLEQFEAHAREAHAALRRHNGDIYGRVRGYLALARRTGFELPWPTVAVLGISQVIEGMAAYRAVALVGEWASRFGYDAIAERCAEVDDMSRRANRAIFADSVPTVLLGLRCAELRRTGRGAVADALLLGPAPITMDEASWGMVHALDQAFSIDDGHARFAALVRLTSAQYEREQEVFTHHLGGALTLRGVPRWLEERVRIRSTRAPVIVRTAGGRTLLFRRRELPAGFDISDHDARVEVLGRLFVDAVTGSEDDFRAAVAWVIGRFEPGRPVTLPAFASAR
jgi:hypothetical protein